MKINPISKMRLGTIMGLASLALVSACQGGGGSSNASFIGLGENAPEVCEGSNDKICIGVKYVAYKDSSGKPVLSAKQALANIRGVNEIWKQCGIAFQLEKFEEIDPKAYGLPFSGSAVEANTADARAALEEDNTFLVVTTGAWNVTKNAWAQTPGNPPYGVVLESEVGTNVNIIAHELGHYLDLDHSSNRSNLLSAVIYPTSTNLSDSQCEITQKTARTFWPHMLR